VMQHVMPVCQRHELILVRIYRSVYNFRWSGMIALHIQSL